MNDLRALPFSCSLAAAGLLFATAVPAQALLRDINTKSDLASLDPTDGVVMQGVHYFGGRRWDTGYELFRSDGTAAGTWLVRDLVNGTGPSHPQRFLTNGSLIFFQGAGGVWRSDGTEAGTHPIAQSTDLIDTPLTLAGSHVVWATSDSGLPRTYRLWSSDGSSPTPVLLLASSYSIRNLVASGSRAFFGADDPATGRELWFTDGTLAGTTVLDTLPGTAGIYAAPLCADGAGGVWFAGYTTAAGSELWHSDGTVAGTRMVADIHAGIGDSSPRNACSLGNRVFFVADTLANGTELWSSDGTAAGTLLARDIAPGPADSNPEHLLALPSANRIYFNASDPTAGREPWVSDGTAQGTFRLADLEPGPAGSTPQYVTRPPRLGAGLIWFSARTSALGFELYRTDGTVAGTSLVADLRPGPTGSDACLLADLGGALLFNVHELYVSPTPAQVPTRLVTVWTPAGSMPWGGSEPTAVAALDGMQHFAASDGARGVEPWRHDGTPGGTVPVADLEPGPNSVSRLLGATTTHVYYESGPSTQLNTRVLYAVPTVGPPVRIASSRVWMCSFLRDRIVFSLPLDASEPMISDGTIAGTTLLFDVNPGPAPSRPVNFTTFGELVFFVADDGVHGHEPWITDGTAAGTRLLIDLTPGTGSTSVSSPTAGRSVLYFATSGGWYRTDGTAAGTMAVPPFRGSGFTATLGDVLFVSYSNELWRTDGTAAGTFRIAQSSAIGSAIRDLCVTRGRVFFTMYDLVTPPQLWCTDGTVAGTRAVVDLTEGYVSVAPPIGVAGAGHVACAKTTRDHGTELWISDGTPAGTVLLADASPGTPSSNPLFAVGDTTAAGVFTWSSETPAEGREPWAIPLRQFGGSDFDRFGAGCPGSRGLPHIAGDGLPILGSPRVAWQLTNARPSSVGWLLLGFTRLGGNVACAPRTMPSAVLGIATDAAGRTEHAIAVPSDPLLLGTTVVGQFLVLDPQGGAFGVVSGTAGLEALIGR